MMMGRFLTVVTNLERKYSDGCVLAHESPVEANPVISRRSVAGHPPKRPQVPYPASIPPPPPPEGTGPAPQASGPAYTVYDQNTGRFADPTGGTGIFAPGINGASSAENWVDLMRDPRPM